jgi:chromosome segregation ATPase
MPFPLGLAIDKDKISLDKRAGDKRGYIDKDIPLLESFGLLKDGVEVKDFHLNPDEYREFIHWLINGPAQPIPRTPQRVLCFYRGKLMMGMDDFATTDGMRLKQQNLIKVIDEMLKGGNDSEDPVTICLEGGSSAPAAEPSSAMDCCPEINQKLDTIQALLDTMHASAEATAVLVQKIPDEVEASIPKREHFEQLFTESLSKHPNVTLEEIKGVLQEVLGAQPAPTEGAQPALTEEKITGIITTALESWQPPAPAGPPVPGQPVPKPGPSVNAAQIKSIVEAALAARWPPGAAAPGTSGSGPALPAIESMVREELINNNVVILEAIDNVKKEIMKTVRETGELAVHREGALRILILREQADAARRYVESIPFSDAERYAAAQEDSEKKAARLEEEIRDNIAILEAAEASSGSAPGVSMPHVVVSGSATGPIAPPVPRGVSPPPVVSALGSPQAQAASPTAAPNPPTTAAPNPSPAAAPNRTPAGAVSLWAPAPEEDEEDDTSVPPQAQAIAPKAQAIAPKAQPVPFQAQPVPSQAQPVAPQPKGQAASPVVSGLASSTAPNPPPARAASPVINAAAPIKPRIVAPSGSVAATRAAAGAHRQAALAGTTSGASPTAAPGGRVAAARAAAAARRATPGVLASSSAAIGGAQQGGAQQGGAQQGGAQQGAGLSEQESKLVDSAHNSVQKLLVAARAERGPSQNNTTNLKAQIATLQNQLRARPASVPAASVPAAAGPAASVPAAGNVTELKDRVAHLEGELRAQAAAFTALQANIASRKGTPAENASKARTIDADVTRLRSELDEARAALEAQKAASEAQRAALESERATASEALVTLTASGKAAAGAATQLLAESEGRVAELTRAVAAATARFQACSGKSANDTVLKTKLERGLRALMAAKNEAELDLVHLNANIVGKEGVELFAETKGFIEDVISVKTEFAALQATHEHLVRELGSKNTELEQLTPALVAAGARVEELQAAQDKAAEAIAVARAATAEAVIQATATARELAVAQEASAAAARELAAARAETEAARRNGAAAGAAAAEARALAAVEEAQKADALVALATAKEEAAAAKALAAGMPAAKEAEATAKAEAAAAQEALAVARREAEAAVGDLREQLAAKTATLAATIVEKGDLQRRLASMSDELAALREGHGLISAQLASLRVQFEEVGHARDAAAGDLTALRAVHAGNANAAASSAAEQARIAEELAGAQVSLEEKTAAYDQLIKNYRKLSWRRDLAMQALLSKSKDALALGKRLKRTSEGRAAESKRASAAESALEVETGKSRGLVARIAELDAEIGVVTLSRDTAVASLEASRAEKAEIVERMATCTQNLEELRATSDALRGDLGRAEAAADAKTTEHQEAIAALEALRQSTGAANAVKSAEIAALEARVAGLEREVEAHGPQQTALIESLRAELAAAAADADAAKRDKTRQEAEARAAADAHDAALARIREEEAASASAHAAAAEQLAARLAEAGSSNAAKIRQLKALTSAHQEELAAIRAEGAAIAAAAEAAAAAAADALAASNATAEAAEAKAHALEDRLASATADAASIRRQLEEAGAREDAVRAELATLTGADAEKARRIAALEGTIAEKAELITGSSRDIALASRAIEQLREDLETATQERGRQAAATAVLEAELLRLRTQGGTNGAAIEEKTALLAAAQERLAAQDAELAEAREQIGERDGRLAAAAAAAAEAEGTIATQVETLGRQSSELGSVKGARNEALALQASQETAFQGEIAARDRQLIALRATVGVRDERIETLERDLAAAGVLAAEATAGKVEQSALAASCGEREAALAAQLEEVSATVVSLRAEVETALGRAAGAEAAAAAASKGAESDAAHIAEVAALRALIAETEAREHALRAELGEARQQTQDAREASAAKAAEASAAERRIDEVSAQLRESEESQRALRGQNETLLEEKRQLAESTTEEIKTLRARIAACEQSSVALTPQLAQATARVAVLEREAEARDGSDETHAAALGAAQEALAAAQAAVRGEREKAEELAGTLAALRTSHQSEQAALEAKIAACGGSVSGLRDALRAAEAREEELTIAAARTQGTTSEQLRNALLEVESLKRQLSELRAASEQLHASGQNTDTLLRKLEAQAGTLAGITGQRNNAKNNARTQRNRANGLNRTLKNTSRERNEAQGHSRDLEAAMERLRHEHTAALGTVEARATAAAAELAQVRPVLATAEARLQDLEASGRSSAEATAECERLRVQFDALTATHAQCETQKRELTEGFEQEKEKLVSQILHTQQQLHEAMYPPAAPPRQPTLEEARAQAAQRPVPKTLGSSSIPSYMRPTVSSSLKNKRVNPVRGGARKTKGARFPKIQKHIVPLW